MGIPFEQKEPDYLLWGCFRWGFASASTPAGCLLPLVHGLDEGARGAKSPWKNAVLAEKLTRYQLLLAEGAPRSLLLGLGDAPSIDDAPPTWL
jgi:hypothetical protein